MLNTRALKLALAGTAVAALLTACGQKGALYLPPKAGAVVTSGPAPAAAPGTPSPTPQSAPVEPPAASPTPPKKTDPDSDSQSPQ